MTIVGLGVGSVVFGAIHLAAWDFVFATRTEQIAWWIASLYCTVYTFLMTIFGLMAIRFELPKNPVSWAAVLLLILYVLARLVLLVEIFRTLCFLPPDAYIATWATNIPHLS